MGLATSGTVLQVPLQQGRLSELDEVRKETMTSFREATAKLREEQQVGLTSLASELREELERVRGEAVSAVLRCWRELQQKSGDAMGHEALESRQESQSQEL